MSSIGIEYNEWRIVTGQDFREIFHLKDPELPQVDNPDYDPKCVESPDNRKKLYQDKDLTGYSAKMDIRDNSGTLIISLETGSGITLGQPNPEDGTVEIFIDNTVTKISPISDNIGKLKYDLFIIPPLPEDNKRILYGTIEVIAAITDV